MSLDSVFDDSWPENHRSGVVAVVGRPNVGKSTLLNAILGQKLAITTPKPQTTRRNQMGIYTEESGQILFYDTPGLHKAKNTLGDYMMTVAEHALQDADIILWILDASEPPQRADHYIADTIREKAPETPIFLVLNKHDLVRGQTDFSAHFALLDHAFSITTSAVEQHGIHDLIEQILEALPLGPRYYPEDQISDLNTRFVVSEIIREKVILNTEHEIPHAVAVEITDYKDEGDLTNIYATIVVERNSQKGIVIGKGGSMIKKIGTEARKDIQNLIERKVFLDLHVKVLKNWRSNETFMQRVGYRIPKQDDE